MKPMEDGAAGTRAQDPSRRSIWLWIVGIVLVLALIGNASSDDDDTGGGGRYSSNDSPSQIDYQRPSRSEVDRCVEESTGNFEEVYGSQTPQERQDAIDICSASDDEIREALDEAEADLNSGG